LSNSRVGHGPGSGNLESDLHVTLGATGKGLVAANDATPAESRGALDTFCWMRPAYRGDGHDHPRFRVSWLASCWSNRADPQQTERDEPASEHVVPGSAAIVPPPRRRRS